MILCQSLPIHANPCQSMPILANPMPISGQSVTSYVLNHRTSPLCGMAPSLLGGWIWGTRALPITINCGQSWLLLANQCQSHANPMPIRFQSRANQMPIHGNSLNQSRINLIHFLPIQANPILIQCQSDANPRSIFLWIFANPCRSMPILANPMPISGQSVTSYVLNRCHSLLNKGGLQRQFWANPQQ